MTALNCPQCPGKLEALSGTNTPRYRCFVCGWQGNLFAARPSTPWARFRIPLIHLVVRPDLAFQEIAVTAPILSALGIAIALYLWHFLLNPSAYPAEILPDRLIRAWGPFLMRPGMGPLLMAGVPIGGTFLLAICVQRVASWLGGKGSLLALWAASLLIYAITDAIYDYVPPHSWINRLVWIWKMFLLIWAVRYIFDLRPWRAILAQLLSYAAFTTTLVFAVSFFTHFFARMAPKETEHVLTQSGLMDRWRSGMGLPPMSRADMQRYIPIAYERQRYMELHQFAKAIPLLNEELAILDKYPETRGPAQVRVLIFLASAYLETHQVEQAEQTFQKVITLTPNASPEVSPDRALALSGLGKIQFGKGDFAASAEYYRQAAEIFQKHAVFYPKEYQEILISYAKSLRRLGKNVQAAQVEVQAQRILSIVNSR